MLNYLDLPIYDRELIYSYLKHQLAHEAFVKHCEKFKSTLDFIKNPCYNGKYGDPKPYITNIQVILFMINFICIKYILIMIVII